MQNNYISVIELTRYLKDEIDSNPVLQNVYLKGEISNFKAHSSGHLYFSLKDDQSRIKAIMFKSSAAKLMFNPSEGMNVLVRGKISVYESTGDYQIYITEMLEDGIGNLYIAFENLKKKLEQEGLFSKEKKKRIPRISRRIGVVTAPTGAAIRDILTTIKRRFPIAEVFLFPSLVQGNDAAKNIAAQIEKSQNYNLDVLIVGRGGGSFEDLFPFSEEIVARTIYNCKIPVVSAVGHEIDFAISDFVADLRAATPTAAAELVVPNLTDMLNYLNQVKIRLNNFITNLVKNKRKELINLSNTKILNDPNGLYEIHMQKLDLLSDNLNKIITNILETNKIKLFNIKNSYIIQNPNIIYERSRNKLNSLIDKCTILNPIETLKRGYTITKLNKKIITSINMVKTKDIITINVSDGSITAEVTDILEEKHGK